jgi:transcriptional regulator with XRE-family HTH domain
VEAIAMSPRAPTVAPPTPEMKLCFGANLARCRAAAEISQEELSFRASIHRTEVSLLERGERMPRVDTALRLAGSLGVPLEELTAGLEWRPGYEVVVPGTWEAMEPEGRPPEAHEEVPADPAEVAASNGSR